MRLLTSRYKALRELAKILLNYKIEIKDSVLDDWITSDIYFVKGDSYFPLSFHIEENDSFFQFKIYSWGGEPFWGTINPGLLFIKALPRLIYDVILKGDDVLTESAWNYLNYWNLAKSG